MKMKKNILILCLGIFAIISCSKDNEAVYSCDPNVNSWAKSNLNQIQSMKRSEWLDLDYSKQKASIIAFTPEEKQNFWLEKLNEVLTLKWNDEEKKHITELYNWVSQNPKVFEKTNIDCIEYIDFEKFMYEWSEKGKAKFGWDMQTISAIAMDGNKMIDITGNIEKRTTVKSNTRFKVASGEVSGSGQTCDCSVRHNYCNKNISGDRPDCSTTSTSKCVYKGNGCGWLTMESCDGYCQKN